MLNGILVKTDLGFEAVHAKSVNLNLIERRVLIMVNGKRSVDDIHPLLGGDTHTIASRLMTLGLVTIAGASMYTREVTAAPSRDSVARSAPKQTVKAVFSREAEELARLRAADASATESHLEITRDDQNGYRAQRSVSASIYPAESATPEPSLWARSSPGLNSNFATLPATLSAPLDAKISKRGLMLGKMYLVDFIERMLGRDDNFLRGRIQSVSTEKELYHIFDVVVDNMQGLASPDLMTSMQLKFMESIQK